MHYYLLEVKSSENIFYLGKEDQGYSFQNSITPSSILHGDSEVITLISIWKNLKHNYFIETHIFELDFNNNTKVQLKDHEIFNI